MTDPMTPWIIEHAHRLVTTDTEAPLHDVRPFADMVGDASVVALGMASRLTRELSVVAHRYVCALVQDHGFRALTLEGDDAASALLDAYVRTGDGDPVELLADARSFWRTKEILGLVCWLRGYNERHPADPVRVTHPAAADRVTASGDLAGIERGLAANTLRWLDDTGHKIVYWGGVAHTTVRGPDATAPPNAGTLMRQRLGRRYRSVGLTFHHGVEPGGVPAPPDDFVEAVLANAGIDAYFLDLREDAPPAVRTWLDRPAKARLIGPRYDPGLFLSGGAPAEWFDVITYLSATTSWTDLRG